MFRLLKANSKQRRAFLVAVVLAVSSFARAPGEIPADSRAAFTSSALTLRSLAFLHSIRSSSNFRTLWARFLDDSGSLQISQSKEGRSPRLFPPTRKIYADADLAADAAVEKIKYVVTRHDRPVLMLPTGNTPLPMYRKLVEEIVSGHLDLGETTIFMLDEYWGGTDYRDYIHANLLDHIPRERWPTVHVLNGLAANPDAESLRYEALLRSLGGVHLAVLGVGTNGHIGFNEPGSALDSRTRLVQLAPSTLHTNDSLMSKPYTEALTVGIGTILESREILLLATGASKKMPVEVLYGSEVLVNSPVSALLTHPGVSVFLDEAASPRSAARTAEAYQLAASRVVWVRGTQPDPQAGPGSLAFRSAEEVVDLFPDFPEAWIAVDNLETGPEVRIFDTAPYPAIIEKGFESPESRIFREQHMLFRMLLTRRANEAELGVGGRTPLLSSHLKNHQIERQFSSWYWLDRLVGPWAYARNLILTIPNPLPDAKYRSRIINNKTQFDPLVSPTGVPGRSDLLSAA